MSEDRQAPRELVIVRRRGASNDDDHHGGAWKIAFADFMTALMCFFLVMWLINSTDNKTITQIATYFNPLRLSDRKPSNKGVHDPGGAQPARQELKKEKSAKAPDKGAREAPDKDDAVERRKSQTRAAGEPGEGDVTDQELLKNPIGALDRIAGSKPFSSLRLETVPHIERNVAFPIDIFDRKTDRFKPSADEVKTTESSRQEVERGEKGPAAMEIEKRIRDNLADVAEKDRPLIEIVDGKREILISITDQFDFAMFKIASAQPSPALVMVMERIAKAMEKTSGGLIVRGHTDGRQFRSVDNDNWRLSMARAQMAYYMLVRGGLQGSRVKRLEGHADQALKFATDPLAPQNRRIEILVEKETT